MAQEGSEASVASTKTNSNFWDIHANSFSWNSWHHHPPNPNSNSCEDDISISAANSFTNASNQSGLSVGSSAATQLSGEPAGDNHLWSQVLLSTGNGEFHKDHNNRENFLEALSSKNLTTDMFGPACDYLKKLDESWEFTNSPSFTNLEKQLNSCNTTIINQEKPTNLSDLVSNWSIAPPQQQPQFDQHGSTTALMEPNFSQIKHEISHPLPYSNYGISGRNNNSSMFAYGHEMKGESQQRVFGPLQPSFLRPISVGDQGLGYQVGGGGNSIGGSGGKYYLSDTPWSNTRNFSDLIKFEGSLNKQIMDPMAPKPCLKTGSPQSPDTKKQALHDSSSSARGNMKITGNASDGKKKRSDDASDAHLKKPKHDNSNSSSTKLQVPKVKLGDRITALQQLVSPFGKTDTASVLLEAINYIKFLHEQVQLLSDPYMKAGANKDLNSWGGPERKEKQDIKLDLSSRGLCLVPISCTPVIYRENTGPDYWTPTYRGCLYR